MASEDFKKYKTKEYADNYERAEKYQDFIALNLWQLGIPIINFGSKFMQLKKENTLGLEIKFDDKMKTTKRMYIETAEKTKPELKDFTPSGIYRDDDNWLYGIGDYETLYIFGKTTLQRLHKANPDFIYHPAKDKATSQGFCIPIKEAEEIAIRIINFKNEEK